MKIKDELKIYSKNILDHFTNPRNIGSIQHPSFCINASNPSCNDMVKTYIVLENDIISDVKIKVFGCTISIASSSVASELLIGKTSAEILGMSKYDFTNLILNALGGVPTERIKCTSAIAEIFTMLRDRIKTLK